MGHRAGLDILENRKIFCPYQDSIPRSSGGRIVALLTMLPHPQNISLEQAMNTLPWPPLNPVSTVQEVGRAPGPVRTGAENLVPTPGLNPQKIQPVAIPYTHDMKAHGGRSGLAPQ
jgi:hypothetical protein